GGGGGGAGGRGARGGAGLGRRSRGRGGRGGGGPGGGGEGVRDRPRPPRGGHRRYGNGRDGHRRADAAAPAPGPASNRYLLQSAHGVLLLSARNGCSGTLGAAA